MGLERSLGKPLMGKVIHAAAAVIRRGEKFLITKRLKSSPMGHCWEFPGGKIEPGESVEQCVVRECREEIDVTVTPMRRLREEWYDYSHGRVHLWFVLCELASGEPRPVECEKALWIFPDEFKNYEFPPADIGVIEDLVVPYAG